MQGQNVDRRIRRTKKMLLQGLTKLMSEKKISNITVKELTDLADVNRSTFYLYYKDIFDMVEQIETEMLTDFISTAQKFFKEPSIYNNLVSFFTYLFEFVQQNAELCKILLGPDGDYTFIEKLKHTIKQSLLPVDDTLSKLHYQRPYMLSGCIGIIQQWLEDDMKMPPRELAVIVTEMIPKRIDYDIKPDR